jgi:hypothetical protein
MNGKAIMSGGLAAALAAVCALSMLVLVLLYAFAPDLRRDDTSAANAVSKSAVGFAGLRELLTLSGMDVDVDRGAQKFAYSPSLVILTPPPGTTPAQLAQLRSGAPTLIILGKWLTLPQPQNPDWAMNVGLYPAKIVEDEAKSVLGAATLVRGKGVVRNLTTGRDMPLMTGTKLGAIDTPQTLTGGKTMPVLPHGVLLAVSPGKGPPVYVLADPDLLNNQGLADPARAHAALALIRALRRGNGPVRMDVTLNGLARTENFLRALFLPPFLGATLCALIVALLMGLHTAVRFGAPLAASRMLARGKKALADNSADLVRIMGREGGMARRYVAATRSLVLEAVAARPASVEAQDKLIATLEQGGEDSYARLQSEAADAENGGDLLRIARKTFAWRLRIIRGY